MALKHNKKVDFLIIALVIVFSLFFITRYIFFQEEFLREILFYGLITLFIASILVELIPQFIHPYFLIATAASVGMNIDKVVFLCVLGSLLGSIIGFEIGRKNGTRIVPIFFKEKTVKKIFEFWNNKGYLFVFIAAVSPVPYFPIVFGSLDMSRRDFILFGLIPRAVSISLFSYLAIFGINGLFML